MTTQKDLFGEMAVADKPARDARRKGGAAGGGKGGGKKGAGILRNKPNIKWSKDRGKEVEKPKEEFPWLWGWDEETINFAGGDACDKNRWNDCHYTIAFKQAARDAAASMEAVQ